MEEVSTYGSDVFHPHQHIKMKGAAFLELEAVEVGQHVAVGGVACVAKEVLMPAVAVPPSDVPPGNLLQGVRHVKGLKNGQVSRLKGLVLPKMFNEGWPGKCPLVWADRQEEWWIAVLADGIEQVEVLPLPVGSRKRFLLKTDVGTTARGTRRVDCPSDRFEEPAVILVL